MRPRHAVPYNLGPGYDDIEVVYVVAAVTLGPIANRPRPVREDEGMTTVGTLVMLRHDPDPGVLGAILENRFTTEPDVVAAAARGDAPVLEVISAHPRWSLRPSVRSALLRNRRLPMAVALALLTRASLEDLEGLRDSPGVSELLKACAQRVLAQRASQV